MEHGARTGNQEDEATGSNGDHSPALLGTPGDPDTSGAHVDGAGDMNAGSDLAGASCDSLEQMLSQRIATAYASVSNACQVDSDCTREYTYACYPHCDGPSLPLDSLPTARRTIQQNTEPVCGELLRRCGPYGAVSCVRDWLSPACNEGTCVLLSCDDLQSRLGRDIERFVLDVPQQCTSDDDCTLVDTSVSCIPSCGSYRGVRAGYESELSAQIQGAGDEVCAELARVCDPIPVSQCPATNAQPHAICVAGQCDVRSMPRS